MLDCFLILQTILRGTTLASKVMACCFRTFGAAYVQEVIKPHIESMMRNELGYEIDPNRLEGDISMQLTAHRKNLEMVTQRLFDAITESLGRIPPQVIYL